MKQGIRALMKLVKDALTQIGSPVTIYTILYYLHYKAHHHK